MIYLWKNSDEIEITAEVKWLTERFSMAFNNKQPKWLSECDFLEFNLFYIKGCISITLSGG